MVQRIFVGDVQGCAEELEALIGRARAKFGDAFELWVAGDLVNRGPDNLRALETMRALVDSGRGQFILGNHDLFLIAVYLGVRDLRDTDSIADVLEHPDIEGWVDWLRARPLVATGEIEGQPFAMVHASSHPDWSLETLVKNAEAVSRELSGSRQAARDFLAAEGVPGSSRDHLDRLTRCRSVTSDGRWSSEEPESLFRPWHSEWSERDHEFGLVYGHWARQGLHVARGLRGLDTGCVHHGRGSDGFLTAWLPDSVGVSPAQRPFDVPDDRIWQIPARRRYYYAANES